MWQTKRFRKTGHRSHRLVHFVVVISLGAVLAVCYGLYQQAQAPRQTATLQFHKAGPKPSTAPPKRELSPLTRVVRPRTAEAPATGPDRTPADQPEDPRVVLDGRSLADGGQGGDPSSPFVDPAGDPAAEELASLEARVVRLSNNARVRAGCRPLRVNQRLAYSARLHSADMAEKGYFSHTSPEGLTPWQRMERAGYRNGGAENIGRGYQTADEAVRSWMASAVHRKNILNCRLRAIGVGVHLGPGGPWWTQDFGYS
ncbi:CAP domain-containing protein [Rhizohabitans arisaemae]|uniref:CAP domain-containing protein n=1 Tax=Rhizohabitans arisaemae TaxID=2720610 RepID=UPI0024B049D6|nr:CAP domain-containing protein [Rhizohabitans arisaemae]